MSQQEEKKKVIKRLRNKYQLVIMNQDTYKQRFSLLLSPLNLLVVSVFSFLIVAFIVWLLIIYTPLKEAIPGYASVYIRNNAKLAIQKTDSLEPMFENNELYLTRLKVILKGEDASGESVNGLGGDSTLTSSSNSSDYDISEQDSTFRANVEAEDAYSIREDQSETEKNALKTYFFPPLKGEITQEFEPEKDHYGIDITAPKNEAIKSILNGTVIGADWTQETGYVIQVQHPDNLLSIYKHNSVLLKKVGDRVSAGDPLAIIGNTGELTTGAHLHLEIWYEGQALNPADLLIFD